MLGDRDFKSTIENSIDSVGSQLDYLIDKDNINNCLLYTSDAADE